MVREKFAKWFTVPSRLSPCAIRIFTSKWVGVKITLWVITRIFSRLIKATRQGTNGAFIYDVIFLGRQEGQAESDTYLIFWVIPKTCVLNFAAHNPTIFMENYELGNLEDFLKFQNLMSDLGNVDRLKIPIKLLTSYMNAT